ncbi:homocysteine S-methyltransferase family protein [Aristaeella lactis]|uniref:5-methyltetrahydrofolate--homocysteine methyltransferase n=1 Tax=Aristaeella lactis TaxID=3046383 RepID=A0AC61PMZ5_9FIRM|nr:homocysteine S-methyltransferase family protein [Aristaeella lactis]QUA52748.1 homocysteine S-methyltransferase family protein [Aristaeella lactis]SMC72887.1 5-methyltetrahydrofolate--homocysteine methyltransferase [Aristaeella lactis]
MKLKELLRKGPFFLDGGMGTLLQARGLKPGEAPERWGMLHPDVITDIQRTYYEAGSDMVLTNTFGVHPLRYDLAECEEMIRTAVACADKARKAVGDGKERFIALDIGPCGQLLKPLGNLPFEEAVQGFAEVVRIGSKYGVDCVFIETMNDGAEARAALLAAKENCDLPVLVSCAYGADGKLMTGGTPESVVAMLEGLGADAVGVNCSLGPDALAPIVERYLEAASVPVLMKPNAGLPQEKDGKTIYNVGPEEFSAQIIPLIEKGLRIIGGCCGTTPDFIRAVKSASEGMIPGPIEPKERTVIASRGQIIELGKNPVIIGERINPTGKKRLRKALEEGDMAYVLNEAIVQEEHGAEVLDVNVGTPGVDEPALLEQAVQELQAVTDLPLQLDTSDPEAMRRALRVYNGKALINSVNGKQEVMDAIFPLVQKYGGAVVALTLDEGGIPGTAEGRLAIAERILKEAEKYGIRPKDILFDTLTMTVSTDGNAAKVTLDALKMIREKTGCGTVLGVSNVSFGLPVREVLGSVFLTLALERGLSGAIMNPLNERMMGAMISFRTLTGRDENCAAYIKYANDLPTMQAVAPTAGTGPAKETEAKGLRRAVVKGLCKEAANLTRTALEEGRDSLDLVKEEIIPALDEVGQGFEAKKIFLPQLMMSAEAAEAAVAEIKKKAGNRDAQESKGTVVLATVKGDIHDIGKNIVKLLLENYGFTVADLGKDVPPETVLEAVERLHAPICGLSALMTTTVPAMAETVALVHEKAPWCRVMVGGAVLTEEYARDIGADGYGKDAMASVRLAERFMQEQA